MHNYLHSYSHHSNVILSFKCLLSIQSVKVCTACSTVLEPQGNVFHSCLLLNTLDGNINTTILPKLHMWFQVLGGVGGVGCIVLEMALKF